MRTLLVGLLLLVVLRPVAVWAEMAATQESAKTVKALTTEAKEISLSLVQEARVGGSADARGEFYEGLEDNQVKETGGESLARIIEGFTGARGIVGINQSPGNTNNQGNLVSFAFISLEEASALLAGGAAEVYDRGNVVEALDVIRGCEIGGNAFDGFGGALQVNQSAGNVNNQNNILSIAAGEGGVVALSEAALGQQVARNSVQEEAVHKRDLISGLTAVSGVVSINQASGSGNNQINLVIMSLQQLNL